jgi:DNA-3-methyladenine glycosylase II
MAMLRRACPAMRAIHEVAGDPPLRRNIAGFPGLARIIIGQQVSVASATAIWARFAAVAQPMSAAVVGALTDDQFREGGLSRPKIKTLRAIAAAVSTGLELDALVLMDEAAARDALTAISGIGPWTADIYLMFCLGRADVFASGDLALQEAARMALGLDGRPSADALAVIADQRWRPWRGVAARMLWHYYAATKAPKSGQPV